VSSNGGDIPVRDWTKGGILRNLLGLSWPMMVTEGFAVVVMTVDIVWVGRLGAGAIAAVGIGTMISGLGMGSAVGLMNGLRAMVARFVGAGDRQGANHVAQQAIALAVAFGVVVGVLVAVFARPIMGLFPGLETEVVDQAVAYVRITFFGLPGFALRVMADGTMQASGDTVTPMKITILTRAIHLAVAPFIILGWWVFPSLGVAGTAVTNVGAHSLAAILGLWVLFTGRSRLRLTLRGFGIDLSMIRRVVRIGFPSLVLTTQRAIAYIVLTRLMVPFGTVAVAAHSLVQRVDMVLFLPSWATSSGAGVLVGQNLGAGQPGRAARGAWLAVVLVEILMLSGAALMLLWGEGVAGIFTSDADLILTGGSFLRIAAAGYAMMALVVVMPQAMAGAGDTLPPMIISLLMVWAVQLPLAVYLPGVGGLDVDGVRWAIVAGNAAGAAAFTGYFLTGRWKRRVV
jgi:putative MATE family efflux protein